MRRKQIFTYAYQPPLDVPVAIHSIANTLGLAHSELVCWDCSEEAQYHKYRQNAVRQDGAELYNIFRSAAVTIENTPNAYGETIIGEKQYIAPSHGCAVTIMLYGDCTLNIGGVQEHKSDTRFIWQGVFVHAIENNVGIATALSQQLAFLAVMTAIDYATHTLSMEKGILWHNPHPSIRKYHESLFGRTSGAFGVLRDGSQIYTSSSNDTFIRVGQESIRCSVIERDILKGEPWRLFNRAKQLWGMIHPLRSQ